MRVLVKSNQLMIYLIIYNGVIKALWFSNLSMKKSLKAVVIICYWYCASFRRKLKCLFLDTLKVVLQIAFLKSWDTHKKHICFLMVYFLRPNKACQDSQKYTTCTSFPLDDMHFPAKTIYNFNYHFRSMSMSFQSLFLSDKIRRVLYLACST